MRALTDVLRRLAGALPKATRHELEDRLDDEIRFHVEQQIEKNRRAGMTPDEARRQALIRFGGVEQMREATRDEFRAAGIDRIEHCLDAFGLSCVANLGFTGANQFGDPGIRKAHLLPPTQHACV